MVTAAEVAAPFASFGRALDNLGEALDDVSVVVANEAGQKAVTQDADGTLRVDTMPPMTGRAGIAYNRAAKTTYAARLEPQISNQVLQKRLEFEGKPQEFASWAEKYVSELEAGQGDEATRNMVRTMAMRHVQEAHQGLVLQRHRVDLETGLNSIKDRITSLDNEMAALARQGGVNTPEYQARQADAAALYHELTKNPVWKYPQERAKREMDELVTRHRAQAIIGEATRIYDKATPTAAAEARKFLTERVWDPGLNLTTAERQKIVTMGMAALEGRTAENKALVDAHKKLVNETIEGLKTDAPYNPRQIEDLAQRAEALGDVESYYKLTTYRALHDWRQGIKAMPLRQQITALNNLRGSSGNLVDRIVSVESGGDPNARARTSSALGLGQFTKSTWLDVIKRNRPDLAAGKSDNELLEMRRNPALSREMIARYAEENREALKNAGVRTDDGALYLAHFLGAGDAIKVLSAPPDTPVSALVRKASIDANSSIFQRNPTAGDIQRWAERKVGLSSAARVMVDAIRTEAVNDFRTRLGGEVEKAVGVLEKAVGKGRAPTPQEITDIVDGIRITGRTDLVERVETALGEYDLSQKGLSLPTNQREAFRARMQQVAAETGDPAVRKVVDAAEETIKKVEADMKARPYSTSAARRGVNPPMPFNFNDPQAMDAAVQQRAAMDRINREMDGLPAHSVFEGQEGEAFKQAMAQGDAATVAGAFAAFNKLDDDQWAATMSDKAVKDAIAGALRSTDPAKYNATMSALDQAYARAPETFVKNFGENAWNELKNWQTLLRYYDPQKLAETRAKADDPAIAERRRKNIAEGQKIAGKKSIDDIVAAFDTSWWVTPGVVARNITGSQPLAPTDAGTRDALMADYQTVFARRYAETLDEDTAHTQTMELLRTKWARSEINGGKLMLRAPETVYPAIDGSHDWMKQQIERDLTDRFGPRVGPRDASEQAEVMLLPGRVPRENWSYSIVPDRRTETEAVSGQPASYMIVVTNHRTGKTDVVRGEDERPLRYRWDAGPDIEARRALFDAERRRVFSLGGLEVP